MAQTRVVDLAKELRVQPAEVVSALSEMGIHLRNYQAVTLDDSTTKALRKLIHSKEAERAAAAASAPAAPATTEAPPKKPAAKSKRQAAPKPAEPEDKAAPAAPAPEVKEIELSDAVTVRDLAEKLKTEASDVITRLVSMGHLVTVTQTLPQDVATKVAAQYGYSVKAAKAAAPAAETARRHTVQRRVVSRPLQPRPPVVTILGHVDHGKTTLLDAIRKTDVVSQEFGGITQHIGAYQTEIHAQDGPKRITFIDTPGHAAFTQMRARGAQVTDIVILVVAADDGIMPQTVEAINHARAAKVPIIVAVNKVDKEDADATRTKQQLMEHGLVPEEWGGDTIAVEISALAKLGIDDLLEMISLVAEMEELRSDPAAAVSGTIVEAKVEKGRGPVATVLVQEGTLKTGDIVVANAAWGRLRAMSDDRGRKVTKAGPATPVEIVGLSSVPMAGDRIEVVKDEREARDITEARILAEREQKASEVRPRVSLQDLFRQMEAGAAKELNLIIKADVQGSVEVLRESMNKVGAEEDQEVRLEVLHTGVGNIGESDIMLASASNAVVIGFNVRLDPKARRLAEDDSIDVRLYNVIYELMDDVRAAMRGMLAPVYAERVLGTAEVRATFRSPRGVIAGCMVTDGLVRRGSEVRILRGKDTVFSGKLSSLRHIKEDVREMAAGFECGVMLDGFSDFQEGDIVQSYVIEEVHRA